MASIEAARRGGVIKAASVQRVIVDTTVMPNRSAALIVMEACGGAQTGGETLDAVVGAGECELVDQILNTAIALRLSFNCDSMKVRCGSHADVMLLGAEPGRRVGGQGGAVCSGAPAVAPGSSASPWPANCF